MIWSLAFSISSLVKPVKTSLSTAELVCGAVCRPWGSPLNPAGMEHMRYTCVTNELDSGVN